MSGRARTALLDSYEAERIPVARRLLDTTDRAFSLVVSDNPLAGLLRTKVLARVAALAMSSRLTAVFSDIQFWVPVAVLTAGALILYWVSR